MTVDSGQSLIARTLLRHVPEGERADVVREAIGLLGQDGSADIDLTTALLAEHPDPGLQQEYVARLVALVEAGHVDQVLPPVARDAELRGLLFEHITERLALLVSSLRASRKGIFPVPIDGGSIFPKPGTVSSDDENPAPNLDALQRLLAFIKRSYPVKSEAVPSERLVSVSLTSLGASDERTCIAARSALLSLLKAQGHVGDDRLRLLWTCITCLVDSASAFHQGLGFSLWLALAGKLHTSSAILIEQGYWERLRGGLRQGDAERRKQCLGIFRRSIALAIRNEAVKAIVCSQHQSSPDEDAILDQFERYCVVFETVLLGRYLNQVLGCQADLHDLSSGHSAVNPKWLYTLLASALTPQVQESIRKFVGHWIVQSSFQPDCSGDFTSLFRDTILPWATQGSLFTASLKTEDGRLRCSHGERLAQYIARLLQRANGETSQLIDTLLDVLARSRRGSFPYASVYVLEGLAKALETTQDLEMQPIQLERLADVSTTLALPEVARDYIHVRCIKLCADSTLYSADSLRNPCVVASTQRWHELQAELSQPRKKSSLATLGAIAAWRSPQSVRDIKEAQSLEKLSALRKRLGQTSRIEPSAAQAALDDIWSDIEYLEYPKRLLLDFPSLLLDLQLVHLAGRSDSLATLIGKITQKIRDLSQTKVYLLPALVCALRKVVLIDPHAARLLPLQEIIVQYAERVPEPTVDLQLEVATTDLIRAVDPGVSIFGYEHYFGRPISLGMAAMLDLTSRLKDVNAGLTSSIYDHLVQRWVKQRLPLPVVSAWKSTLQLQVMLLCCEQFVPTSGSVGLVQRLDDLHRMLSIEPLPRYRYVLSWIIARIYSRRKDLRPRILGELATRDHHSNPKYLASLMKIAVMIAKLDDSGKDFALELAAKFLPLASSSKVVIRHEAQWQVPLLMDLAKTNAWAEICENTMFVALDEYIRSLDRFEQPPLERQLDHFDPVKDNNLTNLAQGAWTQIGIDGRSLCDRQDFEEMYRQDEATSTQNCITLGAPIRLAVTQLQNVAPPAKAEKEQLTVPPPESRVIQTKGTAYLESGLDPSDEHKRHRNDIIVVASLVSNPHNLGGLSRVSEIFAASELHLQNHHVTTDRDFTTVAVSSHLHFPIVQLSAPNVPEYLASKRDEGWKVVGIEQTDRSVLLGSPACKLPKKVVLVIGSEKEGIPALVLGECDMLVEIPQQGITRSLNVQTAAAIVLYEYTRQHRW